MGLGKQIAKQAKWFDPRVGDPTDELPMTMPQSDLPHAPVVQEEQQIDTGYIDVAEEDGDPTQPGDLPIPTTQESDKHVSLATVTRKFRAKFTGQGSSTGERITKNRPTTRPYTSKSLTDLVNSVAKEKSQLVLFVESDGSNSFSAPQTNRKRTLSGNADKWISIDGAERSPDESPPPEPVDGLPIDAFKAVRYNDSGHARAIEYGRYSAKPEDLTIRTTQESEKHISLHATSVTPPLSNRSEVTGQDDSTGLRHSTGGNVLGRRIVRKRPINFRSLTRVVASIEKEGGQCVVFVNSYWSDSFAAPQTNRKSMVGSSVRVSIGIATESADVFPPFKSVDELPANPSKARQPQNNKHAGATKYDRNPAQPRDPVVHTIRGSSECLPLPDFMTQPSPSGPRMSEVSETLHSLSVALLSR